MPPIRNYDLPTYLLTRVKCRDASASKNYNVCRFENKIPSSVDQLVLCKGSSYQLIRDQENCLLLKTALGLFS